MAIFELTLLFMGSIIGAGFVTGAEIVTFFGRFPLPPSLTAIFIGFAMLMLMVMMIARPQTTTLTTNYVFLLIYFILLTTMTAGITQIAGLGTTILALIIAASIVLFGFQRLTKINTMIVAVIIAVILQISIANLSRPIPHNFNWHSLPNVTIWAWLYAGLNCFMFPELIIAAQKRYSRRQLYLASVCTATLVSFLVYLILRTIIATNTLPAVMPLLSASPQPTTYMAIFLAILTSQYAALFAIVQRSQNLWPQTKKHQIWLIIGFCICAFLGSLLGFKAILKIAYPLIGLFTCFFWLFSWLRPWVHSQSQQQS